ncbi:hypothetical protein B7R22_15455 [Subtercola boreus]|uniref:Uncharacterized protein n=1 Tax=Subtercola boreus TaxID=120213 RepID=A0A3E0VT20_9MICO|nr:hypothetical protein B7R22_15455 [Subtercola boreus]
MLARSQGSGDQGRKRCGNSHGLPDWGHGHDEMAHDQMAPAGHDGHDHSGHDHMGHGSHGRNRPNRCSAEPHPPRVGPRPRAEDRRGHDDLLGIEDVRSKLGGPPATEPGRQVTDLLRPVVEQQLHAHGVRIERIVGFELE